MQFGESRESQRLGRSPELNLAARVGAKDMVDPARMSSRDSRYGSDTDNKHVSLTQHISSPPGFPAAWVNRATI